MKTAEKAAMTVRLTPDKKDRLIEAADRLGITQAAFVVLAIGDKIDATIGKESER